MSLKKSKQPQVVRSHAMEQQQRKSFVTKFEAVCRDWIDSQRITPSISTLIETASDFYITFITTVLNDRRLGEQYTYTAMFRERDYDFDGVPLNRKNRILLTLLEVANRNLLWKAIAYLIKLRKMKRKRKSAPEQALEHDKAALSKGLFGINLEDSPQVLAIQANIKSFFLMLFMLKWNPYFNAIQSILKIDHIYTYKNNKQTQIDYRIEGYMLLAVFVAKILRFLFSTYRSFTQQSGKNVKQSQQSMALQADQARLKQEKENQLCRICYDEIKYKTSTVCGHVFCWDCIIKTVQSNSQCPVCRAACLPRQCVQLRNF